MDESPQSQDASRDRESDRENRLLLVTALLRRPNAPADAIAAFRRRYPTAPEEMAKTAAFHVYVDGTDAVLDWLAETELFLRDPNQELSSGTTWHLLHHVYNWHLFQALLPEGKPGLLDLLDDLKQWAREGELEAIRQTVRQIEEMLNGDQTHPFGG